MAPFPHYGVLLFFESWKEPKNKGIMIFFSIISHISAFWGSFSRIYTAKWPKKIVPWVPFPFTALTSEFALIFVGVKCTVKKASIARHCSVKSIVFSISCKRGRWNICNCKREDLHLGLVNFPVRSSVKVLQIQDYRWWPLVWQLWLKEEEVAILLQLRMRIAGEAIKTHWSEWFCHLRSGVDFPL